MEIDPAQREKLGVCPGEREAMPLAAATGGNPNCTLRKTARMSEG